MDMKLEVVVIPVTDVDRSKAYYEQFGFHCDVDHRAGDEFRVVQMTPPGSACSVTFGVGMQPPDSPVKGLHLVVTDLAAAVADVRGRGVEVGDPFHFGPEGKAGGVDPGHGDYASYAEVADPDGNVWLLQEVPSRATS